MKVIAIRLLVSCILSYLILSYVYFRYAPANRHIEVETLYVSDACFEERNEVLFVRHPYEDKTVRFTTELNKKYKDGVMQIQRKTTEFIPIEKENKNGRPSNTQYWFLEKLESGEYQYSLGMTLRWFGIPIRSIRATSNPFEVRDCSTQSISLDKTANS